MTAAVQNRDSCARRRRNSAASASSSRSTPSKTGPAKWEIFTHGGRKPTGLDAVAYAREVVALGAGEILLTSMDRDGTKRGFDIALTRAVADAVGVPVIASGGVGALEHLVEGIRDGGASAVLAASIFHFGEFTIAEAKGYMAKHGVADAARRRRRGRGGGRTYETVSPSTTSPRSSPSGPMRTRKTPIQNRCSTAGPARAAKKLGEEAVETVDRRRAGRHARPRQRKRRSVVSSARRPASRGVALGDVWRELEHRTGRSGHEEKAARKS